MKLSNILLLAALEVPGVLAFPSGRTPPDSSPARRSPESPHPPTSPGMRLGGSLGDPKPADPMSIKPKPKRPKPKDPKPKESKPKDPKPKGSKSKGPKPNDPKPADPMSIKPKPKRPNPNDPKPKGPKSKGPKPKGPKNEDPKGGVRNPGDPMSPSRTRCEANDVDMYTRENWQDKGVDEWFNDWKSDYSKTDEWLYSSFAAYWGLGESFDCYIEDTCDPGMCTDMNRPGERENYERAHMVLTAMSNFNQYCNRLLQALNGANVDFNTIKTKLQDTFYPGVASSDFAGLAGLNALTAVVGIASAWTGPVGMATLTATANSFKEVIGSVSRGVSTTMTASDMSLQILADMEKDTKAFFDGALDTLENEHNNLLRWGASYGAHAMLEDILAGGAWVESDRIAALSGVDYGDVRDFFEKMIFAMTINKAWKEQGVYIISRSMDEAACLEWDPLPDHPKVCTDTRGFWLVRHQGSSFTQSTGVTVPPGASELESFLGFNAEHAMRSSIDAFRDGGYKFDAETVLDESLLLDPKERNFNALGAFKGIFNIPICYPESSGQFKESDLVDGGDAYWGSFMKNYPDEDQHARQACLCSTVYDGWGTSILDIEDNGSGSFRAIMEDAGECNFDDTIIDW